LANFFEEVVASDPKGLSALASTWIADTLIGELNYRNMGLELVDPATITELITLLRQGTITDKSGVEVLRIMLDQRLKNEPHESPAAIVTRFNLAMTKGDTGLIGTAISEAITENPKALEDYRAGKGGALNFLVGQVMKKTRGKSDPAELNRMLLEALKEREA
jgi:aspartyl-tRNA(Asn)/glutamyl-tRNA(Gln) amidotransferase subunit B